MENTNILTTIDNVKSLVDFNFKDTLKCEAETLFSTGGSYEFIKIMQHIYNEGTIYIKRDFKCCIFWNKCNIKNKIIPIFRHLRHNSKNKAKKAETGAVVERYDL